MALPAALFTQAAPYAAWEFWVHLLSGGAVALGALAAAAWAVRYPLPRLGSALVAPARVLLAAALAVMAVALWVVGSPPSLGLKPDALAQDVAAALAQSVPAADPAVTAPAWADAVAEDVLARYADYERGAYRPPVPHGWRLALVAAPQMSEFTPFLAHGDSAPLPNLAHEVVGTLMQSVPLSTLSAVAAARGAAVGATVGTAVTSNRHIPVVLLAVFVPSHG